MKINKDRRTGRISTLLVIIIVSMAFICSMPTVSAATGTDGTYTYIDNASGATYRWLEASSGTKILDTAWDDVATVTIPFTFKFYGTDYTSIKVDVNGLIHFNNAGSYDNNVAIGSSNAPNNFIAPYWDDLRSIYAGEVYYKTSGTAGGRIFVIQWNEMELDDHDTNDRSITFEVLLCEGNNTIIFQYGDTSFGGGDGSHHNNGGRATVGIERNSGSGLQYSYNTESLAGGRIIQFTTAPADTIPPTTTHSLAGTVGANGWFTSDVLVTLTANDNPGGSGINKTYYRINGGGWQVYSTPFSVTTNGDSNTVDYYSKDIAGNPEGTHTATIKIDKTLPTVMAVVISGTAGTSDWYISPISIELSGSESVSGIDSINYRYDPLASFDLYSGAFVISQQGELTLEAYAIDGAGNTGPTASTGYKIDTGLPTTTADLYGTSGYCGWYVSSVIVALNASDSVSGVASTQYKIGDGSWTPYDSSTGIVVTAEGTTHVFYRSTDNAGNVETELETIVYIDETAPVSMCTLTGTSGTGTVYISPVNVMLEADDGEGPVPALLEILVDMDESGVDYIEFILDGNPALDPWTLYDGDFDVTDNGDHTLYYRAVDYAGNVEPYNTETFSIDTVPPVVVLTYPEAGLYGAMDTNILIGFSEEMDAFDFAPGSITVTDQLGWDVPGAISYLSGIATFDPTGILGPNFVYTVTVSGLVKDVNGNPMGDDYVFKFTADGQPQVKGNYSNFMDQFNSTVFLNPSPSPTVTPTATPTPTVTPTVTPTATPTPTVTPIPTISPSTTPTPEPTGDNMPMYLGILVVFLGVVAIAGAAIYFLMFRK